MTYRVRITLCQTGLYYVQFAHYKRRFLWITIWYTVVRFGRPPYAYEHCSSGWEDKVFNYKDAESFAEKINTPEKLAEYYRHQESKEQQYLREKAERDRKSTPYKTKYL